MAKCIQVVGQGVPVRLSDEDAFQVVERDHDGQYCSKNFFKKWYVANGEPLIAKLVGSKITPTSTLHFNAQHSRKAYI